MVPRPTQRVGGLRVLAYENRENASFHRMVSETAAATGLPVTIGAIAPASRRNLMSGDRERWLRGVLPTVRERLVLNVDATDALLLCTAEELSRKYDALAGSSSDLVVGGEVRAWPRYFRYEGVSIYRNMRSANATAYPARPDGMNGVLPRYVNIGTILGPARSYAKMLECMHEAYGGYPDNGAACPADRRADGEYLSPRQFFAPRCASRTCTSATRRGWWRRTPRWSTSSPATTCTLSTARSDGWPTAARACAWTTTGRSWCTCKRCPTGCCCAPHGRCGSRRERRRASSTRRARASTCCPACSSGGTWRGAAGSANSLARRRCTTASARTSPPRRARMDDMHSTTRWREHTSTATCCPTSWDCRRPLALATLACSSGSGVKL